MVASGVSLDSLSTTEKNELVHLSNALSEDLNNFDITKPCALHGDLGHAFSGCQLTQLGIVQQNYINLRLLENWFRHLLNDFDKSLNLNMFKNANLNHLETTLPAMLN